MELLMRSVTNQIIEIMKQKGIYHEVYINMIEIMSGLLVQYYTIDENMDKSVLSEVLNCLKDDIVLYGDRLELEGHDLKQIIEQHMSQFKSFRRGVTV